MTSSTPPILRVSLALALFPVCLPTSTATAAPTTRSPKNLKQTIYVSKTGDNSDGSSWKKAFTTIQAALNAVPTDSGGYRIAIRPDTYNEANLHPAHRGAKDAYNELVGDVDGSLGSGTTGRVIIDSSDPKLGFKSYDWHTVIRAYQKGWSSEHKAESTSSLDWDRWRFSHLYVTGSDAGLFFDLVDKVEPFSVEVEDCICIGRAFGGGVANCLSRRDEPVVFRRCYMASLDFWGDTSGAYIRFENKSMPDWVDIILDDCTMLGPQCAFKSSNFGFHTYTHARLTNCRLIVLNFSQPHGTPTDGIIQCVQEGKLLHVDLENCSLMGYKVFGVIVDKKTANQIKYTTQGDVKAYIQFQQELPAGFQRIPNWPVELFEQIAPPALALPTP